MKTFLSINFGCRTNAAETNQWSQTFINQGFTPNNKNPDLIFINTCAITKKGEKESINKIKFLNQQYPKAEIYVTGCANFDKIKNLSNVTVFKNDQKEKNLKKLKSFYSPKIGDKFSHTHRFILKVQSGCNHFCSYCIVPFKRPNLWSLKISDAIKTINSAVENGYQEIIITGINLNKYQYDFSDLIKNILNKTKIKLISFGSIPTNCIDQKFINLYKNQKYSLRLSHFLHIPLQSGSDKILKLMNRPYNYSKITKTFNQLNKIKNISFGTDIIVGFPNETDEDFQNTLNLCQKINFKKIHVFKFSPRPNTKARIMFENSPKISKEILKTRSQQLRNLV